MPKIGFLHISYARDAVGEKQPKTASYIFPTDGCGRMVSGRLLCCRLLGSCTIHEIFFDIQIVFLQHSLNEVNAI